MLCPNPKCHSTRIRVTQTYSSEYFSRIERRRECKDCNHRWTTTETGGKLILSSKAVEALDKKIIGHTVPVYETDHNLKPIRRQNKLICRGKIVKLQPPIASLQVQFDKRPDVKTDYGYLCLIKVTAASPNHKDKIGQELIFNITNEDINRILAKQ